MRAAVLALDHSFGGAFGDGRRRRRRNDKIVDRLAFACRGDGCGGVGPRHQCHLSLSAGGRTGGRKYRRAGRPFTGQHRCRVRHRSERRRVPGATPSRHFLSHSTNIFSALSLNDSLRVLCFAIVFGIGMVITERQTGLSIFGALRHVQAVCITIFDWFNLLVPIGIVALIAPQVAQLGADAFRVLALFAYAFLATAFLLLSAPYSSRHCRCTSVRERYLRRC